MDGVSGVVDGPVPRGNAAAALGGLLSRLGIASSSTHDVVSDAVAAVLGRRGYRAEVASLRYGQVEVSCDPQTAALLRYDLAAVTAEVNAEVAARGGEPVRTVRARVARGGADRHRPDDQAGR